MARKKNLKSQDLWSKELLVGLVFVIAVGFISFKLGNQSINIRNNPPPETGMPLANEISSPSAMIKQDIEESPLTLISKFYDYISSRKFDLAYDLLSENYKKGTGGQKQFARGYSSTTKTFLSELRRSEQTNDAVYIKLIATDNLNDKNITRTFVGAWKLIKENGKWKLHSADIQQID